MLWDDDSVADTATVTKTARSKNQPRTISEETLEKRRKVHREYAKKAVESKQLPYPAVALADETALPYTPFARSTPVPATQTQLESHPESIEALKRQADNPLAPTATPKRLSKNKMVRSELRTKARQEKKRLKRAERIKAKREREIVRKDLVEKEGLSEAQAEAKIEQSKKIPRTTENMRVFDETLVVPDDIEVLKELEQDEMGAYFTTNDGPDPKVLLTSSMRPSNRVKRFMTELTDVVPNSRWYPRGRFEIRMIIKGAIDRNFTDLILIEEDRKRPHHLIHCHLPEGPTAYYKLTSLVLRKRIVASADPTDHNPELILNNFNTRLGHTLGRMFASLFPKAPEFEGRRVVTFHNQRDFIFFRHHRYIFEDKDTARLQECGPRFTLKLEKLQHHLFDPRNQEYIWISRPREMGKKKKNQHL